MKRFIRVLTAPSCWLQNYRYTKSAEALAQKIINNPSDLVVGYSQYEVKYHGVSIWIRNKPYAFNFMQTRTRPSRATILELYDVIDTKILESITTQ